MREQSSNSENIRNVGEKIPPQVFSEFLNYLESKNAMPDEVPVLKKELIRLAQDGSIESFRKIENMINEGNLSGEMKDFAMAALNYCRFAIENDLLDMSIDMISGGLGGTTNKIRYYLALSGKDGLSRRQSEYLFLQKEYYLTNAEIPTDDRIRDWLNASWTTMNSVHKLNAIYPI